jgi:uncharacterized protein DUF6328
MARPQHRDSAEDEVPRDRLAQETLEEARIVLPGIQALFGFQLIAIFAERFRNLAETAQTLHYAALLLVALSVVLIMTPVAYHRLAERRTVSQLFLNLASVLIAAAMLPLMVALSLEVYIVGQIIVGNAMASFAAAALFILTGVLWFGFPLSMRKRGMK